MMLISGLKSNINQNVVSLQVTNSVYYEKIATAMYKRKLDKD